MSNQKSFQPLTVKDAFTAAMVSKIVKDKTNTKKELLKGHYEAILDSCKESRRGEVEVGRPHTAGAMCGRGSGQGRPWDAPEHSCPGGGSDGRCWETLSWDPAWLSTQSLVHPWLGSPLTPRGWWHSHWTDSHLAEAGSPGSVCRGAEA